MRYITIFSTVFAISGVVLILGSLMMIPYTVSEPTRVDRSKTWVDDIFTLLPNSNRTYHLDSVAKNWSIFQIRINRSDALVFKIAQEYKQKVVFQSQIGLGGGGVEIVLFWTPPFDSLWLFVFENPYETSVNVTGKVTEFYSKIIEYKEATYYHSLLDHVYGYTGIIAIIAGTALNIIHVSRSQRKVIHKRT
jgi:hypothetical protein